MNLKNESKLNIFEYNCEIHALVMFGFCCGFMGFGTFILGLVKYSQNRKHKTNSDINSLQYLINSERKMWIHKHISDLLTGKLLLGRFLILLRTTLCLICMAIYVSNTYLTYRHFCLSFNGQIQFYIEFGSNCILLIIFILKLVASTDPFRTWISIDSFIDQCTILISLSTYFTKQYQFTFGFLYFARLTNIPESLVLLRIINQERTISLVKLIFKLLALWTVLSGMVLLLERIGNFWMEVNNPKHLEYLDCLYLILVTLSTVGYGDIVCTSFIGRLFIICVIIGALISVTTHMSQLHELFQHEKQYTSSFNVEYNPRHIVLCGSINFHTVSTFFNEHVNADRGRYHQNIMLVVLSNKNPDIRLQALIQRESTNITFLKGQVTSQKDLLRAKVKNAEAVIILTDQRSQTSTQDDWENIMCVVSIKNYDPHIRIICELMLFENKNLMSNIPGWNEHHTDQFDRVICMSQLKLGLLALNCLCNGISTMLCNLITQDQIPSNLDRKTFPLWMLEYFEGTKYKFYTVKFSSAFDGMLFQQMVGLAMQQLNLLVLAVQIYHLNESTTQLIINPGIRIRIHSGQMRAVLLAKSLIEAQRLRTYNCGNQMVSTMSELSLFPYRRLTRWHSDSVHNLSKTEFSNGPKSLKSVKMGLYNKKTNVSPDENSKKMKYENNFITLPDEQDDNKSIPSENTQLSKTNSVDLLCDSTGLFYWIEERNFASVCLSLKECIEHQFKDHILICLTEQPRDNKLGLANFILPLRSTLIPLNEIKIIVFLCESKMIEKEWRSLKNLPEIYVLKGSPHSRAYLRAAGVETCSTCVVLSCPTELSSRPTLMIDRESILCTLNIRRMLGEAKKSAPNKTSLKSPVLITELCDLQNVCLLSSICEITTRNGTFSFSPLIAAGNIFESNVLYSLSSNVFFDPTVFTFIETLLSGGTNHQVEKVFTEDSGYFPGLRGQPTTSITFPCYYSETMNYTSLRFNHDCNRNSNNINDNNQLKRNHVSFVNVDDEIVLSNGCNYRKEQSINAVKLNDVNLVKNKFEVTKVSSLKSSNWKPINNNSFLSYRTQNGDSVTVRLSRLRLIPLYELDSELYNMACQDQKLTFGQLFQAVLNNTGTISIGLYRCVQSCYDWYPDSRNLTYCKEMSNKIERFVYTFPDSSKLIYPDDMIYCLTSMTEYVSDESTTNEMQ